MPLTVYDIDGATPRRLTLGFLENNASGGRVNGVYRSMIYTSVDNYAGSGPLNGHLFMMKLILEQQ